VPKNHVATICGDQFGFVGVELRFPWSATAPDGTLLRDWVAGLPGARWDKGHRAWVVPEVADIPPGALTAAGFCVCHHDGTPARRSDLESPSRPPTPAVPTNMTIPSWFGLALYDYQRDGALEVAAGRRLLADAPGVGKTRTALAAAAALGSRRTLVVCPSVVVTHWTREAIASGLGASGLGAHASKVSGSGGGDGEMSSGAPLPVDLVPSESTRSCGAPDYISVTTECVVSVVAGRKTPEFPPAGVVIVGAQLVSARPELDRELREWAPTVFICDEAHLAKSWGSQRSRVLRRMARSCPITIPTTGTPVLANPVELAPLLEMAGVLESEYGSFLQFRSRFTRKAKWGYSPIKKRLPELRRTLDEGVWVRRTKEQVLGDLPPKSRRTLWVDITGSEYDIALNSVITIIDEWIEAVIDATGEPPSEDDISEWVETQRGMVVKLRRAAGIAKAPAAAALIREWYEAVGKDGALEHPLVVWTHHHAVTEALVHHLTDGLAWPEDGVTVIDGGVDNRRRTEIVDRFQAGQVPVLVCSIHAAGVGITLTRAREALFVETDWTPALVVQAEDRMHRISQESPVTYTTLIAAGTLDERVHAVLSSKAKVVGSLMDGDYQVFTNITERMLVTKVLSDIVHRQVALLVGSGRSAA